MNTEDRLLGVGELVGHARLVWAMRSRPGFSELDEDYVRGVELHRRSVEALGLGRVMDWGEDPNEAFERAMAEGGRGGWAQVSAVWGAVVLFGLLLGVLLVIRGGCAAPEPSWQIEGVKLVPGAYGIRIDDHAPQDAVPQMQQERTFDHR